MKGLGLGEDESGWVSEDTEAASVLCAASRTREGVGEEKAVDCKLRSLAFEAKRNCRSSLRRAVLEEKRLPSGALGLGDTVTEEDVEKFLVREGGV